MIFFFISQFISCCTAQNKTLVGLGHQSSVSIVHEARGEPHLNVGRLLKATLHSAVVVFTNLIIICESLCGFRKISLNQRMKYQNEMYIYLALATGCKQAPFTMQSNF